MANRKLNHSKCKMLDVLVRDQKIWGKLTQKAEPLRNCQLRKRKRRRWRAIHGRDDRRHNRPLIGFLVVPDFPIPPLTFFFVETMDINHSKEKNNHEDDNENDCHWLTRPNLSKKIQRILNHTSNAALIMPTWRI